MRIIIKILERSIYLEQNPSNTIEDIKMKIKDEEGIPIEFQNLYLKNELLKNNETLSNYNIKSNEILRLYIVNNLIIFIQPLFGRKITLESKISDTVSNIKKEIENKENIKMKFQILKYKNIILNDIKTLGEYNIENNSIIELSLNNCELKIIKIYIALLSGRRFCLNAIYGLETIRNIKEKIEKLINISILKQKLYYKASKLEDDKKLDYYKIEEGSELILFNETIIIFVKHFNGKIASYEINLTDTINDLKKRIQEKYNLEYSRQELYFNNEILNNMKTLADYNIKNESILILLYEEVDDKINVFINFENKPPMSLLVSINNSVGDIKNKILMRKGKYYDVLRFSGFIMKNDRTLAEHNVQNNSNLFTY